MVQAVIFDMDGLMLDTERIKGDLREEVRRELGYAAVPGLRARCMGATTAAILAYTREAYGDEYPHDLVRARTDARWKAYIAEHGVPVMPGLFELLAVLERRGVGRAVASSTVQRVAQPLLEQAGIVPHMQVMLFGDMVKESKPAPGIFLAAAEQLGVAPEHCAVLEDSPNGVRAGRRAGMYTVMVPDVIEPDDELRALCDAIAGSLHDVAALLGFTDAPGGEGGGR